MRFLARALYWLLALLLLSSCGIPQTLFIGAPARADTEYGGSPTEPWITFVHNSTDNNSENFLGYEIYYKFYPYASEPLSADFGSEYAQVEASGPGTQVLDDLHFRRLHGVVLAGDSPLDPPLLRITETDRAKADIGVRLTFPDRPSGSDPAPADLTLFDADTESGGLFTVPLRESNGDPLLYEDASPVTNLLLIRDQTFLARTNKLSFESDDIDITEPGTVINTDIPEGIELEDTFVDLAIVIIGYGTDFSEATFTRLYSEPLMIERPIQIVLQ